MTPTIKLRNRLLPAATSATVLLCATTGAGDFRYRLRSLNRVGQPRFHVVRGLNDLGQVIGIVQFSASRFEGARWEPATGALTLIPRSPGCAESVPLAINNLGHIAGGISSCPEGWVTQGLWWSSGPSLTFLGDLPGGANNVAVWAMNAHDQVTGYSDSAAGTECVVWDPEDGLVSLGDLPGGQVLCTAGDINDAGWVVGAGSTDEMGTAGVVFIPGQGLFRFDEWTNVPFVCYGLGYINNLNQMSGAGVFPDTRQIIFSWDPVDGYIAVPGPGIDPEESLSLRGMNDLGWIIGDVFVGTQGVASYIWDPERGVRLVRDLIDPCAAAPFETATYVAHLNNHGWMTTIDDAYQNLAVLIPYILGDLDESEMCDLQDLAILLSNFSRAGDAEYEHGDLDCDEDVDLQDLAILLANFGENLP